MHLYALDIETDTSPITDEERAQGYTSRGLTPAITPIISVALSGAGEGRYYDGDEDRILALLQNDLQQLPAGLILTWNGAVFDLPFIADRAAVHGMELGLHLQHDPAVVPKYEPLPGHPGGYAASWATSSGVHHAHADLFYELRPFIEESGAPARLKPFSRCTGLDPIDVDQTKMHLLTEAERRAYNLSDTDVTLQVGRWWLDGTLRERVRAGISAAAA